MAVPTPPTPLSYPPPHWLLKSYSAIDSAEHRVVTVESDIALHLSLEYAVNTPSQVNRRSWRRGMGWVRDKHWSFHPVGLVSQHEEGDTTTHTFYVPHFIYSGRLWFRFAHDYAAQYTCPSCAAASLPRLAALTFQQDRQFLQTLFYCGACQIFWHLAELPDASASKSTSPFFSALPAESEYSMVFADFMVMLNRFSEVFSDDFSS